MFFTKYCKRKGVFFKENCKRKGMFLETALAHPRTKISTPRPGFRIPQNAQSCIAVRLGVGVTKVYAVNTRPVTENFNRFRVIRNWSRWWTLGDQRYRTFCALITLGKWSVWIFENRCPGFHFPAQGHLRPARNCKKQVLNLIQISYLSHLYRTYEPPKSTRILSYSESANFIKSYGIF